MRAVRAVCVLACLLSACSTGGGSTHFDAGRGLDGGASGDAEVACTVDRDCDDHLACTIEHCVEGACESVACTDCCDDGLRCVPGFGCRTAPTPCTTDAECVDEVRCTLDSCRDATDCQHMPQNDLCPSGQICLPAVGCIPEPPTSCTSESDCDNGSVCVGRWSCDPEFGCQFVSLRNCDDHVDCTADSCSEEAGGCIHPPRDVDRDLHGDSMCGGDDCNDNDPAINPARTEDCDGGDEDCDGSIDEECCAVEQECPTPCGTTGHTRCDASGTMRCQPPDETCNAADDDCDGERDELFACIRGAREACTTSCGTMGTHTCDDSCGWGPCEPPAETCNGADDDCDGSRDEGFACTAGTMSPCITSCGSMGTRNCLGDCTFDTCIPPAETCNGVDDDCDGSRDEDFPCVRGAVDPCATSCGTVGSSMCSASCTPGACLPPLEMCNGTDDDCDGLSDEGFTCRAGDMGTCPTGCGSIGTRTCTGACGWDLCYPPAETCNGVDDDCDTACDDGFTCCRGSTRACNTLGFYAGNAVCANDCGSYDMTACTNCGNGSIQTGEQCDLTDLGMNNCTTIGMNFGSGTLSCTSACTFNTTACSLCRNGVRNPGEQCDGTDFGTPPATCTTIPGGYSGGTLGCNTNCTYNTSACTIWNPTGTYTNSPHPIFSCTYLGFTVVNFNIATFGFTDDGTTLRVTGAHCGPSGPMTGPTARNPTRSFDVQCTFTGMCDETYRLVGMFTSDNQWTGTFTAYYNGDCDTCDNPPNPHSWSVTGTRP